MLRASWPKVRWSQTRLVGARIGRSAFRMRLFGIFLLTAVRVARQSVFVLMAPTRVRTRRVGTGHMTSTCFPLFPASLSCLSLFLALFSCRFPFRAMPSRSETAAAARRDRAPSSHLTQHIISSKARTHTDANKGTTVTQLGPRNNCLAFWPTPLSLEVRASVRVQHSPARCGKWRQRC